MAKKKAKTGLNSESRKIYRQARKRAARMGCKVEIERIGSGRDMYCNYWVWGPFSIYRQGPGYSDFYEDDAREDPCSGEHVCTDWNEVMANLDIYKDDIAFHRLGISYEDTQAIQESDHPEIKRLLRDWLDTLHDCKDASAEASILADAMEEFHSDHALAQRFRKAISRKDVAC